MLTVHRSSSGDALAAALGEVLADPLQDPFAAEVLAVPAKGVERWLAQRLSHRLGLSDRADGDGVCANVVFPSPATLLDDALRAAMPGQADAVQLWAPQRAAWPLVEVLDAGLGEDWCRVLARHLGTAPGAVEQDDRGRRMSTALRLAARFDDYGQARPELLQAWAAGQDGDVPDDLQWQVELWRRLRDRIGHPSPAESLAEATQRLRDEPGLAALPARFGIFGLSRLAPARLSVLAALAEHREVHLWLHHPSPALWAAVRDRPGVLRRADATRDRPLRNPLLASLSRDLVELQHLLARQAPAAHDLHHPAGPYPATLLGWLKQDLAQDADTGPDPGPGSGRLLDPDDRSIQVHACHGRTRQVEVVREAILGLLAADPTLEPRDVLIMCPDVETFAPLFAAAFSLGAEQGAKQDVADRGAHPAARLRVRIADRALRRTNPLLDVLAQVLELGIARISAPQLLDLAGLAAVRRRFGFDDEALERLREWVLDAGVRWGLDAAHRGLWQLSAIGQGTWRQGLDRLLLGVALDGERTFGDVLACDDVDSAEIELVGRFAELVDRVALAQQLMTGRHPIGTWLAGLEQATSSLAEAGADDGWQLLQLRATLTGALEAAGGSSVPLGAADVAALLADDLAGRPTRAGFRTGMLTVCTLVPMRSVPHRVICLVGLDDGQFPRQSVRDGDDLLARDPWVGERDPRSEDRQLLLDAIGAAGEHLVITYLGADERTGSQIPPAVPLGELLDALDRTAQVPGGGPVRDQVVVRQPLQPFDPRNFTAGALGAPGPFSFDGPGLRSARASRAVPSPRPPLLSGPLPELAAEDVQLEALQKLLLHPAKEFLRQRLELAAARAEEDLEDGLPIELDNLEQWTLGDRLLQHRLAGMSPNDCIEFERRRGLLPPGALGDGVLRQVGRRVERIVAASAAERAAQPQTHDVELDLTDGTRLSGTVQARGDRLLLVTYSRPGPKHRLRAWTELVALTAAQRRPWRAAIIGREREDPSCVLLDPIDPDEAARTVEELVALYRAGLRGPLPLPLKTGAAYAERRVRGSRPHAALEAAQQEWLARVITKDQSTIPGEQDDDEHELVHGPQAPLRVLLEPRPEPDEAGPGWAVDEPDRFGLLARRVWDRLLAHERRERR